MQLRVAETLPLLHRTASLLSSACAFCNAVRDPATVVWKLLPDWYPQGLQGAISWCAVTRGSRLKLCTLTSRLGAARLKLPAWAQYAVAHVVRIGSVRLSSGNIVPNTQKSIVKARRHASQSPIFRPSHEIAPVVHALVFFESSQNPALPCSPII